MFKVFKKGGKEKEGKEGFELRFRFHATRVPVNGYKQLQVSIFATEKNKETAKTSAMAVRNGACQWPDTITESVHLLRDKRTNQLESKVFKFVVSTGQGRGGVLGETSLNIADCHPSSQVDQKALPLKNCSAGTILNVTLQMIPLSAAREDDEARSEVSEIAEGQEVEEFTDDELSDEDNGLPPQVRASAGSFQAPTQKSLATLDPPMGGQPAAAASWAQPNGLRVTPAASYEMDEDDNQEYNDEADNLRFECESLKFTTKKLTQQVASLTEQLAAAAGERDRLRRDSEAAKFHAARDDGRARLADLEESLDRERAQSHALRSQLDQLQDSHASLLEEMRESEVREQHQQAEIEGLMGKARDAEYELQAFARTQQEDSRRAGEEDENWRAMHAEQRSLIEELTMQVKRAEHQLAVTGKPRDSDVLQKLAETQAENARLVEELDALRDSARSSANQLRQIDDLEKEATELAQENFQIAQDLSHAQAALAAKEEELADLRSARSVDSPELARARARIEELEAEARSLAAQAVKLRELWSAGNTNDLDSQLAEAEETARLERSRSQEIELELAAVSEQLTAAQNALNKNSSTSIAELEADVARLEAGATSSDVTQQGEADAQLRKAAEMGEALGEEVVRLHEKLTDESTRADEAEAKLAAESATAKRAREESQERLTAVESALEKASAEVSRLKAELGRVLGVVGAGEEAEVASRRAEMAARAVSEKGALEARVAELEAEVAELEVGEGSRRLRELSDELSKVSGERDQLTRQVEVRDEELGRLRQEKVATAARMMVAGMRKGTMFSPPQRGVDESSELRIQVQKLEQQLKQNEDELAVAQRKAKTAEILAATLTSDSANSKADSAKSDGAASPEDLAGPLYRKIRILETSLAEAKEENKQTERVLREHISKLEFANEQLVGGGGDGTEQIHHELMRLQHQNASMRSRERELTTMLSKQEVLEFEVERLQELNDELQQRLTIQRDVMEGVKTVERLEMELHEALELNRLYKGQLKNALASPENVQSAAIHNYGSPDQVIEDMRAYKKKSQQLETDLTELRQRYAELSLKFVENEQCREDLVMKVKQMRLSGAANGGHASVRILDSLPSFSLWDKEKPAGA